MLTEPLLLPIPFHPCPRICAVRTLPAHPDTLAHAHKAFLLAHFHAFPCASTVGTRPRIHAVLPKPFSHFPLRYTVLTRPHTGACPTEIVSEPVSIHCLAATPSAHVHASMLAQPHRRFAILLIHVHPLPCARAVRSRPLTSAHPASLNPKEHFPLTHFHPFPFTHTVRTCARSPFAQPQHPRIDACSRPPEPSPRLFPAMCTKPIRSTPRSAHPRSLIGAWTLAIRMLNHQTLWCLFLICLADRLLIEKHPLSGYSQSHTWLVSISCLLDKQTKRSNLWDQTYKSTTKFAWLPERRA